MGVWGVAPSRAKVSIERKDGSKWKPLGSVRAKGSHVFAGFVGAERGSLLRARQGSSTSVPFKTN